MCQSYQSLNSEEMQETSGEGLNPFFFRLVCMDDKRLKKIKVTVNIDLLVVIINERLRTYDDPNFILAYIFHSLSSFGASNTKQVRKRRSSAWARSGARQSEPGKTPSDLMYLHFSIVSILVLF